jgi:hypothetical protein
LSSLGLSNSTFSIPGVASTQLMTQRYRAGHSKEKGRAMAAPGGEPMNVLAMPRDYRRKLKTTAPQMEIGKKQAAIAAALLRAEAPAIKKLAHDSKTSDTSAPKAPGNWQD